ncbi:hypothetical protein OROHE_017353 [Orobanche hederae]
MSYNSLSYLLSLSSNQLQWLGLDFQEYAKPLRLVPATQVKVRNEASVKKAFASSSLSGGSMALYRVNIQTSKVFGSSLSDVNSGILLCLIDENGTSILQRLPSTSAGTDTLHFQRGSIDEFAFAGPSLGRVVAVWIGLESGQWRISGLSLTTVSHSRALSAENSQEINHLTGLQYSFNFRDILLGEKNGPSMMEFVPHPITSFSDEEPTFFDSLNASPSLNSYIISNEESMKEYSYLKFSLLLYDAVLILAGSTLAYFSTWEDVSYAFLIGGLFGFSYLLLLQRSVDGISVHEFVPSEDKGIFGRLNLKGSVSSLVLAFALAVLILKYAYGEDAVELTPKDVVFGMMGFLMCKVSVVLAAFKLIRLSFGDNEQSL